jgi:hemerythrin superfamily protein
MSALTRPFRHAVNVYIEDLDRCLDIDEMSDRIRMLVHIENTLSECEETWCHTVRDKINRAFRRAYTRMLDIHNNPHEDDSLLYNLTVIAVWGIIFLCVCAYYNTRG